MDEKVMDEKQVRLCIKLFLEPEQITEVRVPNLGGRTFSKFFCREEVDEIIREVKRLESHAAGIYFIPNPLKAKLPSAAGDVDIKKRRWFLVDFDPVRSAGHSATDNEKEAARHICLNCAEAQRSIWGEPIMGDSGNGYHLCYPCDLPNSERVRQWASATLRKFNSQFSNDAVTIDTSVFNASRIWKLYGTMARKGEATEKRPHRIARIIGVPQ